MKKTHLINNRTNRLALCGVLGLLGLTLATAFAQNANTDAQTRQLLSGETSKRWELRDIKTFETAYHEKDFNANDDFEMKSDLAQLVPNVIVFKADGSCELTYVSHYENGKVVEGDYKANGKWSVEKQAVKIIEDVNGDQKEEEQRDETMRLNDVAATEKNFTSKFELQGDYTGGVEGLGYESVEDDKK